MSPPVPSTVKTRAVPRAGSSLVLGTGEDNFTLLYYNQLVLLVQLKLHICLRNLIGDCSACFMYTAPFHVAALVAPLFPCRRPCRPPAPGQRLAWGAFCCVTFCWPSTLFVKTELRAGVPMQLLARILSMPFPYVYQLPVLFVICMHVTFPK